MRRVTDRPIPTDVQARILDAAVRAPSGTNAQAWRFILVDDPAIKAELGPLYRRCRDMAWAGLYKDQLTDAATNPGDPASRATMQMKASVDDAADHFERYPLLLFGFTRADPASIFPAVWSAMLAARGEGVGSALTSVLALVYDQVLAVLGVPADSGWKMACCVTFGYPKGRWGVAARIPADQVSFANQWDQPLSFAIDGPLWR
jgi:nitroreductase